MNRVFEAIICFLAMTTSVAVFAQPFPNRPIRFVVAFGAGSNTDVLTRIISQKLTERIAQPVIVDNRPGANGILATEMVAKAPPDGYTLLVGSNGTHGLNPSKFSKLPYDPVKDFEPISQVQLNFYILAVRNGLPAKSVAELVSLAKASPGVVSYGTGAPVSELGGIMFAITTGVNLNIVAYKTQPQVVLDLVGNRIDFVIETVATVQRHMQAGSIRAIAVTSKERSTLFPTLPTVAESGYPEYELTAYNAIFAPARTPQSVIAKLNAEITAILNMPDVRESFLKLGVVASPTTPARLSEMLNAERAKWAKLYRDAKIEKSS